MVVSVQTVYPCVKCGEEISPYSDFCSYCGAKQDFATRMRFNVFTRPKGTGPSSYHATYAGLILSIEDAVEVEKDHVSPYYDSYIGGYFGDLEMGKRFEVMIFQKMEADGSLGPNLVLKGEKSYIVLTPFE